MTTVPRSNTASPSLRTRTALAAATAAAIVVVAFSFALVAIVARQQEQALDRRLDALAATSSPVLAQQAAIARRGGIREPLGQELAAQVATTLDSEFVARAYDSNGQLVADLTEPGTPAPDLPGSTGDSRQTVEVDGRNWRVAVGPIPDGPRLNLTLLTALPTDDIEAATAAVRRRAFVVGTVAIIVAALLGWALAGRALTPLRRLREHAAAVQDKPTPVPRGYAETRETAELAAALDDRLARLDASRARTAQALETARDYAAAAAHELRTPLTTMRTDLDVLRAHPPWTRPSGRMSWPSSRIR